jgi:hypothetical protein
VLSATFSGKKVASIWQRQKVLHAPLDKAQPIFIQFQVTDDLGLQKAYSVGSGRVTKAGMKFLGHTSAADYATTLENPNAQPRHAQIRGAGEAVVAGTDYNGINIGQSFSIGVKDSGRRSDQKAEPRRDAPLIGLTFVTALRSTLRIAVSASLLMRCC